MDFRRECAALLLLCHTGAALEIIVPPTYQLRVGSSALIPCNYTVGHNLVDPTYFAAFWYFQGQQILSYDDQVRTIDPRYSINTDKVLNGIVDLSISKIRISDAGVYTCSVLYSPIQKKEDITVDVEASPQLVITNNVVGMNEESVLNCSVTGFYPKDITITWLRGTETLGPFTIDGPRSNSDGTFNVSSSVTITPTEEDRERDFSCRVQHHKSLQEPVQIDFKLKYRETKSTETKSDNNQTLYMLYIIIPIVAVVILVVGLVIHKCKIRRQKNEETQMPLTSAKNNNPAEPMKTIRGTQSETGLENEETQMPLTSAKNNNPAEPMKTRMDKQSETGPLPDLRMGEITVPELIEDNKATLTCKLSNYINGVYTVTWLEEKGNDRTPVSDPRRLISTDTDEEPGDQNTYKSSLTLMPVTRADNGIKYICRVERSNSEWTEERCTGYLQVTGRENSQKSPERENIPEIQIKARNQSVTPKKWCLEEQNADEPRSENRTEKTPVEIHGPPAEQEADLQEEYNNHENPVEMKLSNSEEHSLPTKSLDEKEIDTSGERSTMEDEEEVTQEKEEYEKPSEPIGTSSPEEETELEDFVKMRGENSRDLCSSEESPDDEETSLMSNNLEERSKELSTTEEVRGNSDCNPTQQLSDDDDDDDENKPLNNV